MPAAVVESLKNLIRHGKHHLQAQQPQAPPPKEKQEVPQTVPDTAQRAQQPVPDNKKAAELIVTEERKINSKMPTFQGLENFQLTEKMGDGAFSNVYKAQEVKTNQGVAVKVVRKFELNLQQAGERHLNQNFKKIPRATERANILKEVQIMRGIHHPSIVKLVDFSESPEHYFIVLELMDGGELFHQIVKYTYFSENLSRHIILQVARGIRYLHEERGVVHRDIKPENLLFTRIPVVPSKNPIKRPYDEDKEDEGEFIPGVGGGGIGRVKIADFGLSKVVWDEQTMTPCGTVGYTAPEIVKDERYSKSVDMWALGCVLYTLLCGFPPFYDESISVLTEKVARGYFTFLSPWWDDISGSSKDLITHLLCVDASRRYTIDEFLTHPWSNAAPAPPPPPTPFAYGTTPGGHPLDSPLLSAARGGRPEGRSPGLATLKEAFDITYAVHRMEEEGARRRKYKARGPGNFLPGLNEDEETLAEEENVLDASSVIARRAVETGGRNVPRGAAGGAPRNRARGFELEIGNATLLGRRHNRSAQGGVMAQTSPLRLQAETTLPPGARAP